MDIEVVSSTKYISGGGTGLGGLLIDYGHFDWSQHPSPVLQTRTKRVGKKLAFTARVKTELVTNLGSLMTPQAAYMETLGLCTLMAESRSRSMNINVSRLDRRSIKRCVANCDRCVKH